MSVLIGHRNVGLAEAVASLSSAIGLHRHAISKSGKTLTADQVCLLIDEISARIEVTAKLHKSLAQAVSGNGVNLGKFLQEIAEMMGDLVWHRS